MANDHGWVLSLADDDLTVLWQLKPQKLTLVFQKFLGQSCFLFQFFSTKQEFFFTGLVWSWFIKHISIPNRKFLVQYRISGIFPDFSRNLKFGNSRFIFGTETGPGRGCSRMLETGNFLDFSGKKSGSREMAFGNADL